MRRFFETFGGPCGTRALACVLLVTSSVTCGDDGGEDNDTGTQTGDGADDDGETDDGGTDDGTDDDGETGGGDTCDPEEGDSACASCVKDLCCDALKACANSTECTCFWDCYLAAVDLPGCATQCGIGTDNPSIRPVASCAFSTCASVCN